jgi:hypothetical protein
MFNTRLIRDRDSFTASTELINLSSGRYIDKLTLAWTVTASGANNITVSSALDLVQPVEVRRDGSTIISIRGSDLYALNQLVFGNSPLTIVSGATDNNATRIMGLNVPLWQPPTATGRLTFRVVRVAVTNGDTEDITIAEHTNDKILRNSWLHYVNLPLTTGGSTGYGNIVDLPQVGDLLGLMFYSTTIPTNSADTATLQSIDLNVNGKKLMTRNWHELKADSHHAGLFASPGDATILANYGFWDLRSDPIPQSSEVQLDINAGVASEAIRIYPLYAVKSQ